nr:hypothetical protein [Pseudomonadota bacterium]
LTGDGFAGFTSLTPLPVPPGAQSFTAHTVLEFDDGRLFTTDAGMVMANGNSIEELTIIGGSGAYAEASGTLRAFGNLLGGTGQYTGELCLPEED